MGSCCSELSRYSTTQSHVCERRRDSGCEPPSCATCRVVLLWPYGPSQGSHTTLNVPGFDDKAQHVEAPQIGLDILRALLQWGVLPRTNLRNMHVSAWYPWRLLHKPVPFNVFLHPFPCIFDPEMLRFLAFLVLAAKAKISPVNLQARIKEVRCRNDGHETKGFPGGLVYL